MAYVHVDYNDLYISPIATPGLLFIFNADAILYVDLTEETLTSFLSFVDNVRTLVNIEDSGAHILGIDVHYVRICTYMYIHVHVHVCKCVI